MNNFRRPSKNMSRQTIVAPAFTAAVVIATIFNPSASPIAFAQEACCFTDGTCQDIDEADCASQGGAPGGVGSVCDLTVCCVTTTFDRLDVADPIYNRVAGGGVDLNCNLNLSVSGVGTAVRYVAIPINSINGGLFSAEITDATFDTTMTLYCDPFDVSDPTANIVAYDDDDGEGALSAFLPLESITLNLLTRYWIVVSTFDNGVAGDFTLCIGGGFFIVDDADEDGILDDVDPCFGDHTSGDSDGDGTCDDLDFCPDDPNKILDGGFCGCGTVDDDSDGDGVPDCLDGCPNDVNKLQAGLCGCGNPDVDSDGDGWLDCFDNCPNDPNPLQEDDNSDGVGNACDVTAGQPCPGTGMMTMSMTMLGVGVMRRRGRRKVPDR